MKTLRDLGILLYVFIGGVYGIWMFERPLGQGLLTWGQLDIWLFTARGAPLWVGELFAFFVIFLHGLCWPLSMLVGWLVWLDIKYWNG